MRRILVLVGLVVGCDDPTATTTDAPVPPTLCDDAPLPVTWNNFGSSFMTERCQSCHATATPDRQGAPDSIAFDTEEQVWALAPQVLNVATGDAPRMPPQGGVDEEDRYLLEVWLTCGG